MFVYDAASQKLSEIDADGGVWTTTYDPAGNVQLMLDPRAEGSTYTYDAVNHPIGQLFTDSSLYTFTYDPVGNRLTAASEPGIFTSTYDPRNQLQSLAEPGGKIATYTYDPAKRRIAMAAYGTGTFTYVWDPASRQTQVVKPSGQTTTLIYDALARVIERDYANGAVTTQTYDPAGNNSGITNLGPLGPVSQFAYIYNDANQRTVQAESDGTITTWTYDPTYQLLNENRAGGPANTSFNMTHTYDPAGNRIVQNATGSLSTGIGITTYTYSPANRLELANLSGAITTYTIDAAGNRLEQQSAAETVYYTWNASGQMATAEPAAGTVTMTYNADNQRIAKESTDGSGTGFLFDFKRLLSETDEIGGDITKTYTTSTDDEYGDLISEGGEFYHQFEAQANTDALLDDSGNIEAQYKYLAFGQVQSVSIAGGPWTLEDWEMLPLDLTSNMLAGGKKGYYLDMETALYLLGQGNSDKGGNYVDPPTTRFLSDDPSRQAGGINLQRYVENNPIMNLDPSGHDDQPQSDPNSATGSSTASPANPSDSQGNSTDQQTKGKPVQGQGDPDKGNSGKITNGSSAKGQKTQPDDHLSTGKYKDHYYYIVNGKAYRCPNVIKEPHDSTPPPGEDSGNIFSDPGDPQPKTQTVTPDVQKKIDAWNNANGRPENEATGDHGMGIRGFVYLGIDPKTGDDMWGVPDATSDKDASDHFTGAKHGTPSTTQPPKPAAGAAPSTGTGAAGAGKGAGAGTGGGAGAGTGQGAVAGTGTGAGTGIGAGAGTGTGPGTGTDTSGKNSSGSKDGTARQSSPASGSGSGSNNLVAAQSSGKNAKAQNTGRTGLDPQDGTPTGSRLGVTDGSDNGTVLGTRNGILNPNQPGSLPIAGTPTAANPAAPVGNSQGQPGKKANSAWAALGRFVVGGFIEIMLDSTFLIVGLLIAQMIAEILDPQAAIIGVLVLLVAIQLIDFFSGLFKGQTWRQSLIRMVRNTFAVDDIRILTDSNASAEDRAAHGVDAVFKLVGLAFLGKGIYDYTTAASIPSPGRTSPEVNQQIGDNVNNVVDDTEATNPPNPRGGILGQVVGGVREATVAKLVGGKASGEIVNVPGLGETDIDVKGPNGELIAVGGPAKAGNLPNVQRSLQIYKVIAAQRGVTAQAYFTSDTPQSVIDLAKSILGADNVHTF